MIKKYHIVAGVTAMVVFSCGLPHAAHYALIARSYYMANRIPFPDPEERMGRELFRRADEIVIRFNLCDDGPVASFRIEGGLNRKEENGAAGVDWRELLALLELLRERG